MNLRNLYQESKKVSPTRSKSSPVGEPAELVEIMPNLKNNTITFVFECAGITEATNHLAFIEFRNTHFIPDEEFTGNEAYYYNIAHEGQLYWVKKHRTTNTVRVSCSCFTGDTQVLMADGSTKTFYELSQLNTFEVITNDGIKFTKAQAINCSIKKWNTRTIELTFEDNSRVKCTPDHIFFLADYRTKCKAENLLGKNVGTKSGMLKVTNIQEAGNADVYCLTVPEKGNFCLSNGCMVQNCSDYYFTFAWWNWLKGVNYAKKPIPYQRKTTTYPERNPEHYLGICKHIKALVEELFELDILEDRVK